MGGLGLRYAHSHQTDSFIDVLPSPLYIGRIMASLGFVNIFAQLFLSARIIRRFGPRTIFITTFVYLPCCFLAYPLLNLFARRAGRVDGAVIAVMVFQMGSALVVSPAFGEFPSYVLRVPPYLPTSPRLSHSA
jgi:hypothetical protein